MTGEKEWLNQSEVARMLGVTEKTIRNWWKRKIFPVTRYRFAGIIRYQVSDIEKFQEEIKEHPERQN